VRRKTHERILAERERRWLEERRELFSTIGQLNDRLMWLVGVPYQGGQQPEEDEPETPLDELPATAIEQYPTDDEWE
jgi:hypothetical protein